MCYIHMMDYYSAIKRKRTGSFVEIWMDVESVMQIVISQKEKNITYLSRYVESRKMVLMRLFATGIKTQDVENEYVDMGCGGMNWEIKTDVCALPCIKQTASGKLLYRTRSSVFFDDLEGGDGGRGGMEDQEGGDTHTHTHTHTQADSFCCIAETNITL